LASLDKFPPGSVFTQVVSPAVSFTSLSVSRLDLDTGRATFSLLPEVKSKSLSAACTSMAAALASQFNAIGSVNRQIDTYISGSRGSWLRSGRDGAPRRPDKPSTPPWFRWRDGELRNRAALIVDTFVAAWSTKRGWQQRQRREPRAW
jgi:hypothetical protein